MCGQGAYGKFLYLLSSFAVNLKLRKLTLKNKNKKENAITGKQTQPVVLMWEPSSLLGF